MNIIFESRLKVQTNGSKNIYYLPVVGGSTSHELPFSVPVADVEVLSRHGISDLIAPIRFDDIVTLEVSYRFNALERKVWQRLFEGRLLTPESQFGTQNTSKMNCVGHADESRYMLIEAAMPLASGVIEELFVTTLTANAIRLCINPALNDETLPTNGDSVAYQIKAYQKYLRDFLLDLEKVTAYKWYCTANPQYNHDGTLVEPVILDFLPITGVDTPNFPASGIAYKNETGKTCDVVINWGVTGSIILIKKNGITTGSTSGSFTLKPNETITITYSGSPVWTWYAICTKYKVIQGTPRFISASFIANGENVYTKAIELGQTPSAGTQFNGWAENTTATAKYNKRYFMETDTGFGSNDMCADFASGIVTNFAVPKISGQVVLVLTPEAQIGDYIEVKIPPITLNGLPINYYLTVHKVTHDIRSVTTALDVGFRVDDPDDYLINFARMTKQNMSNFVS